MANVDGIREYNRIRRFLGRIYLYGFFSREDFARAGVGSVKDYDYGAKLIRAIFPDSGDAALWQDGKKYLRIQRRYARTGENRMTDSYMLHTMDEREELPELLYILSGLRAGPKTLDELCSLVELHCGDEGTSKYPTVRRRVLDLVKYGYVVKKGKQFSLAPDLFENLNDRELEQLWEYVRFSGGVTYPRTAASFLRRTLEREMLRRGLHVASEPSLRLRHSVNANVFDEEMVYRLLSVIQEHRMAELEVSSGKVSVLPVALRADTRLGRWYVLTMEERPTLRRISGVLNVKPGASVGEEEWQEKGKTVLDAFAHTGCSGAMPFGEPVAVEARLEFGDYIGMRNQFARELPMGEIVNREDGEYFVARVNDPNELLPLLRAFSPWLRVLPGCHGLDEKLRGDLLAMKTALEGRQTHEAAE